jgi:hypothetical protein
MPQTATVVFIGKASDAPPELQGFINFRAGLARREDVADGPVAVLRLGALDCYHVLLLDEDHTLASIEKELAAIDAALDRKARAELSAALGDAGKRETTGKPVNR